MTDTRLMQLRDWIRQYRDAYQLHLDTLSPASADASFRRYFRVQSASHNNASLIVMDAPPPQESIEPFLSVQGWLRGANVLVPEVFEKDTKNGFLLLSDFGNVTLLSALEHARQKEDPERAVIIRTLYAEARTMLITLQLGTNPDSFPRYTREKLHEEMQLFPNWYVGRHANFTLSPEDQAQLDRAFTLLAESALAQPQVWVHRDYHSRNLMVLAQGGPGVLDFQDAVIGPITYDLVSLFRDAYIDWAEEEELDWVVRYWEAARGAGLPVNTDFGLFYRDYEWMGLQRQLKVLGIFARLYHRDGKEAYLKDLPRVLKYARRTAQRYHPFFGLLDLFDRLEGTAPEVGYTF